jgi:hypothetical protein
MTIISRDIEKLRAAHILDTHRTRIFSRFSPSGISDEPPN